MVFLFAKDPAQKETLRVFHMDFSDNIIKLFNKLDFESDFEILDAQVDRNDLIQIVTRQKQAYRLYKLQDFKIAKTEETPQNEDILE
jgi:hypothetical protein